jgi:hypothetical protein
VQTRSHDKTAQGTPAFPFTLEIVSGQREIQKKFIAKQIDRSEMNIEIMQMVAEVTKRAQQFDLQAASVHAQEVAAQAPYVQAQQEQSKQMMEMGLKLMQGPAQTAPRPVSTDCNRSLTGWECTSQ